MAATTGQQKLQAISSYIVRLMQDGTITPEQGRSCLFKGMDFMVMQGYGEPAEMRRVAIEGKRFDDGPLKQQYQITRNAFLDICPEQELALDQYMANWSEKREQGSSGTRGR